MLLPFFLLRRKAGSDMLTAFWRVGRPFGAALTAACGLFCVYMAASTAGHFSFFLVSTVYQNAKQWVFVLLFLLAAAYAAALGLEAFSRAGGFFFAAAMAAGALLLFALLPEVDLANLANPFLDPARLPRGRFAAWPATRISCFSCCSSRGCAAGAERPDSGGWRSPRRCGGCSASSF